jgi:LPXTG-motif cell wall-anchored protein
MSKNNPRATDLGYVQGLLFAVLAGVLFGANNPWVTALGLIIILAILLLDRKSKKKDTE